MRNDGYHKYKPTFVKDISVHDMDMPRQTRACVLTIFAILTSHFNFIFTDVCLV